MFIRIMCNDYFFFNMSINKFENLAKQTYIDHGHGIDSQP